MGVWCQDPQDHQSPSQVDTLPYFSDVHVPEEEEEEQGVEQVYHGDDSHLQARHDFLLHSLTTYGRVRHSPKKSPGPKVCAMCRVPFQPKDRSFYKSVLKQAYREPHVTLLCARLHSLTRKEWDSLLEETKRLLSSRRWSLRLERHTQHPFAMVGRTKQFFAVMYSSKGQAEFVKALMEVLSNRYQTPIHIRPHPSEKGINLLLSGSKTLLETEDFYLPGKFRSHITLFRMDELNVRGKASSLLETLKKETQTRLFHSAKVTSRDIFH